MKKVFYADDFLEFKIHHKWIKGKLKDILIEQSKYIISLEKGDELEMENRILLINNYNLESEIKNFEGDYGKNQRVEFYEESTSSWTEGVVKKKNNDFFIISYSTETSLNNSRILYKNNIRPLTYDKDILRLNLNNACCYSLKNFKELSNPKKYAKRFIKKLIGLLNEKISFIFLNNNFDLFIFSNSNENENHNLINEDMINGLIEIAINHFRNVKSVNKK
jgi:hypothetical protein